MFSKERLILINSVVFLSIFMTSNVSATIMLPDPNLKYGSPGNETYVAWANDDFWSYSAQLMDAIYDDTGDPAMDFDLNAGTGTLDIKIYSNGQANLDPPLETSVPTQGGNITFVEGWWGQNDQNNDGTQDVGINGPVTVNQVMDSIDSSIPVFYMDLNQTGVNQDLFFTGEVIIYDHITGEIVESFSFDSLGDNTGSSSPDRDDTFDEDFPGFSTPGDLDVDAVSVALGVIDTGYYEAYHNLGGGKYDYIGYSPILDLLNYHPDDLFVAHFRLGHEWDMNEDGNVDGKDWGAMNNGPEEIFLTGLYQEPPPSEVPEPATMLLLGTGIAGLAGSRLRKKKKKL